MLSPPHSTPLLCQLGTPAGTQDGNEDAFLVSNKPTNAPKARTHAIRLPYQAHTLGVVEREIQNPACGPSFPLTKTTQSPTQLRDGQEKHPSPLKSLDRRPQSPSGVGARAARATCCHPVPLVCSLSHECFLRFTRLAVVKVWATSSARREPR